MNVGAEIMGRNKFGPVRGPWPDLEWQGWWGDTPPFRTPVFVLTHHVRPSFSLSDTTFHFLDAEPAEALRQAKAAANGKDVRLGGGVSTLRAFLDADLVDAMHVAVVPVELGRGGRLWGSEAPARGGCGCSARTGLQMAEGDASLGQIVRRHFNGDPVTHQYLDAVHFHLARAVGEDFHAVAEFDAIARFRENVGNDAFKFDGFFFSHSMGSLMQSRPRNGWTESAGRAKL